MFYDLALIRYTFAFTLCFLFKISFRNRQVDLALDLACYILAYLLFMVHSPSNSDQCGAHRLQNWVKTLSCNIFDRTTLKDPL